MAKAIRSAKARNDLKEIFNYVADDSSESRATKLLKQLERTMQQLADSPGMGTERSYLAPGILGFPKSNYIIFYRKVEDDIQIVRVLHGRRDIENIF